MFYSPFSYDDYQILRLSHDGDTLFQISEPYTEMVKTPEEIASEHMSYICDTPGFNDIDTRAISARWEPDPMRYAITGLYVDRMQRFWFSTGRGEGPSPVFKYTIPAEIIFSPYQQHFQRKLAGGKWYLETIGFLLSTQIRIIIRR